MTHRVIPQSGPLDPIDETSENHFSRKGSGEQLRGNEDFSGPVRNRSCTDLPCLLVFMVLTLGLIAAAVYSKHYTVGLVGDSMRTVFGYDFRAEVCGVGGLASKRFMYFPDPDSLHFPLCVSACPYYYVRNYYCVYDTDHETCLQDYGAYSTIETTALGYYCVPGSSPARNQVLSLLYGPMWTLKRAAGDVKLAWSVLALAATLSTMVGILHLALFRNLRTVKPLIVTSVLLSVGLLGFLAYLFYENYGKVRTN